MPASSRIEMIVEGIGRPIEPLKSSPGRLMHAAGEVSVRPQACVSTLPVTAFQRSATARCTAMPPPRLTRRRLKSRLSKPGVCSSALNRVFTPLKNVKRCFASSATNAREITRVRDEQVVTAELHERQEVRGQRKDVIQRQRRHEHRRLLRVLRYGRIQASACSTLATRLRCVSTAPFDTPVVPPVYCRNAMSSWSERDGLEVLEATLTQRMREPNRARAGSIPAPACGRGAAQNSRCVDFGKPSRSPTPVTMTVSSAIASLDFLERVRKVFEDHDCARARSRAAGVAVRAACTSGWC